MSPAHALILSAVIVVGIFISTRLVLAARRRDFDAVECGLLLGDLTPADEARVSFLYRTPGLFAVLTGLCGFLGAVIPGVATDHADLGRALSAGSGLSGFIQGMTYARIFRAQALLGILKERSSSA